MSPASTPRPPEYTGSEPWIAYSAQKNATGRSAVTPAAVIGPAPSAPTASSSAATGARKPASAASSASRSGWASCRSRTGLAAHSPQRRSSIEANSSGPPGVHDQR